jgi:K+-sensing histidine kinase KdpD
MPRSLQKSQFSLLNKMRLARPGSDFVARTIEDRSVAVGTSGETISEETQQTDSLDRLAVLNTRTRPYSIEALAVAVICLSAATGLRLVGSWTNSDFLFATYVPAILAAGLIAGIPAAVGVTIASAFIIRVFFVPSYLHSAQQSFGEYIDFLMYLISAALTISFAHYCRVVLNRLHKRNLTNEILARECNTEAKMFAPCSV